MTPSRGPRAEEPRLWARLLDRRRDRRGRLRPRAALVLRRQRVYSAAHGPRGGRRDAARVGPPVSVSVHVALSWPPAARARSGSHAAASITDHLGARVAVHRVDQAARHAPARAGATMDQPSLAAHARPAAIEPRVSLIARVPPSGSPEASNAWRSGNASMHRAPSASGPFISRARATRREPAMPSAVSVSGSSRRPSVEPPRMNPRRHSQAAPHAPAPRTNADVVSTALVSPARRGIRHAHAPAARQVSASPAQAAREAAIVPHGSTTPMPRRALVLHRKANTGSTPTIAPVARARRTLSIDRPAPRRRSTTDGAIGGSPIDAIASTHAVARAHVRPRRALLGRDAPETTTVTHAARVARSSPSPVARAVPAETQHAPLFTQPVDRRFAQPPPAGPTTSAPVHEPRPQPAPAPRAPVAPVVDIARLSEDVYQHIQRRVRIERERRGL